VPAAADRYLDQRQSTHSSDAVLNAALARHQIALRLAFALLSTNPPRDPSRAGDCQTSIFVDPVGYRYGDPCI
jgi:hypothetical protein